MSARMWNEPSANRFFPVPFCARHSHATGLCTFDVIHSKQAICGKHKRPHLQTTIFISIEESQLKSNQTKSKMSAGKVLFVLSSHDKTPRWKNSNRMVNKFIA
jgi:hypothetical protein